MQNTYQLNPTFEATLPKSTKVDQVGKKTSLVQAYSLALRNDLSYASAAAGYRAAQELIPQARSAMRPQLALNASIGASSSKPVTSTTFTGESTRQVNTTSTTTSETATESSGGTQQVGLPGLDTQTTSSSQTGTTTLLGEQVSEQLASQRWENASRTTRSLSANAELSMRWPIFKPVNARSLELSVIQVAQAEMRLQAARQEVALRLCKAYFDVILSKESLKALAAEKEAIEGQLVLAERSFKEGEVTIADVAEAKAKWDIVQAQEVAQRNTLQVRISALQAMVGQPVDEVQSLREDGLMAAPPQLGRLSDWLLKAETQAFSVLVESFGLSAAEKELARQRAASKPSVEFVATLGAGRNLQRTQSASSSASSTESQREEPAQYTTESSTTSSGTKNGEPASGTSQSFSSTNVTSSVSEVEQSSASSPNDRTRTSSTQFDAYVGVRLNIPLYDGGFSSSKTREALALQDKKALDLKRAKVQAGLDAETAYLEAQGFLSETAALKAAEQSAKVSLKSNQMGFKAGVRINADILNAQQQLFGIRRDLIRSQIAALMATLRLKSSVATLSDDEVRQVVLWLE